MAFSEFWPLDYKSLIEYIKATLSLSSKLKNHQMTWRSRKWVMAISISSASLLVLMALLSSSRLTEQVVFSDPYYKVSETNGWTSPYLDSDAEAVPEDNFLKLEVAELKSL